MTELATRDLAWARKITERLRLQATNYQEARDKIRATIAEAQQGDAAGLLGYASWTAYAADVLGDAPLRLERDERRELVQELSQTGMSTRAIAPIVGVHHDTVATDIKAGVGNPTPAPEPSGFVAPGEQIPATTLTTADIQPFSDEQIAHAEANPPSVDEFDVSVNWETGEVAPITPKKITGLDGKQYKAPEPKKPNRRAITDQARDAGWNLRKAMEKVERILEDDRYSSNRKEVATHLRGHLMYVIETCQGILDDFESKENES